MPGSGDCLSGSGLFRRNYWGRKWRLFILLTLLSADCIDGKIESL
jgi:hypothetical protein